MTRRRASPTPSAGAGRAEPLLASVVINNHDYGRFLAEAIDSALAQTYRPTEVIVVDDGSTDGSRDVAARYEGAVTIVLKENGGQISAINAGFAAACGDVVHFLDSDDVLFPDAVGRTTARFASHPGLSKVHGPLRIVDVSGRPTGDVVPASELAEGDLLDAVLENGPDGYAYPPTSGNAWARPFLEAHLPLPELESDRGMGSFVDGYLSMLAPFFGPVARIEEPLGSYRLHGDNDYARGIADDATLERFLQRHEAHCEALAVYCRARGFDVDPTAWRGKSWGHRFRLARRDLTDVVPRQAAFALIDDQTMYDELGAGRRLVRFLEREGTYHGPPADDAAALEELARLRSLGIDRVVIAWPSFWWLDSYESFAARLRRDWRRTFESDRLIVYEWASEQ